MCVSSSAWLCAARVFVNAYVQARLSMLATAHVFVRMHVIVPCLCAPPPLQSSHKHQGDRVNLDSDDSGTGLGRSPPRPRTHPSDLAALQRRLEASEKWEGEACVLSLFFFR